MAILVLWGKSSIICHVTEPSKAPRKRLHPSPKGQGVSSLTRPWRGESGANPSPKIGLFRAILDGNKLVLAPKIAKDRNPGS
jgi:hypothetical protein